MKKLARRYAFHWFRKPGQIIPGTFAGPDHEKIFNVVVRTSGKVTGAGSGASKKEAEQRAAAESLQQLKSSEYDETSKED